MSTRTELGKIKIAKFGNGGYQDAMVGISFQLGGEGWGVDDFWGYWSMPTSEHTKWTNEDRVKYLGEMVMKIDKLLGEAKVDSVDKLAGIPIECTFKDYSTLESWRVLKEVL